MLENLEMIDHMEKDISMLRARLCMDCGMWGNLLGKFDYMHILIY